MSGRWPSRLKRLAGRDAPQEPTGDGGKAAAVLLLAITLCLSRGGWRQISLHFRNCLLEPPPQCLLHLVVLTIALKTRERIAAIIQRNLVAWYRRAPLVTRNKVHQETFRARVSSFNRPI